MGLTKRQRREIRRAVQPLWERLPGPADGEPPGVDDSPEELIERWRETVAFGEEDTFRRRLDVDGLTDEELPERFGPTEHPEEDPSWLDVVDELVGFLEAGRHAEPAVPATPTDEERPFEHVLDAVVEFARHRLGEDSLPERLTDAALGTYEDTLGAELARLYGQTLFVEFKYFLKTDDAGEEGDAGSREGYRTFVHQQLDEGLQSLFVEYPVLARWTGVVIEQWTGALAEFAERLDDDAGLLEGMVDAEGSLPAVEALTSHGDRHHHGRRVLEVTFASGDTVAYKPRSLEPEARFNEFVAWVNRRSSLPDLRTVDCRARDGYGWMEWVDPAECSDRRGVGRYYERVGVLTCLLYLLRFTDGNIENIIAAGDQPVVLDLEALMQPEPPDEHLFAPATLHSIVDDSVVRTGILPLELEEIKGSQGIFKERAEQTTNTPSFSDVNTDAMELEYDDTAYIEGESLPTLDGETVEPFDHAEAIADGFEAAYEFLLDEREALLDDDGPVEMFAGLETRFFYRSTSVYGTVRKPLVTSEYLRSGLLASIRLEQLARWIDWDSFQDELWRVYESERDAIWRYDIPRFTVDSSARDIHLEDDTLEGVLERTPLEQVRERVRSLGRDDLQRQLEYFVAGYDVSRLRNPTPEETAPPEESVETPSWETTAREMCADVMANLRDASYRTSEGDIIWYDRVNHGDGIYIRPCRDGLYGGRMGIALFGAACVRALGREEDRELVVETVAPLLDALDGDGSRYEDKRLGAAHGIGSLVYGFTKLGAWLDEPRYTDAARRLGTYLTADRVSDNDVDDLIGGTAGAVVGLLALHDETRDPEVLKRAVVAGDALLDSRIEVDGVRLWPTYGGEQPALVGPGHGISGISLALYRLGERSGERRFTDAAMEALSFEEAHYSPDEQNWPDFRFDSYREGWCAGRSGVGLSRLAMLEEEERDVLWRDFERALGGVDAGALETEDHVCCGNFSRVEFLLRSARFRNEPEDRRRAEQLAAAVVRRAERNDGYSIAWQTDNWYTNSMFLGEPGVAYSMLRLAGADLPCLLLWE